MNLFTFFCITLSQQLQTTPCQPHNQAHCMRCQCQRRLHKRRQEFQLRKALKPQDAYEEIGVYACFGENIDEIIMTGTQNANL